MHVEGNLFHHLHYSGWVREREHRVREADRFFHDVILLPEQYNTVFP